MAQGHWETDRSPLRRGLTPRFWLRLAVSGAVLALLAALLVAVLQPFWHPRTHLVVLTGGQQLVAGWPPIEYAAEDAAAFSAVEGALHERDGRRGVIRIDTLRTQEEMTTLGERLASLTSGDRDVLVLYIAAHGVVERGTPYLVCGDAEADDPTAGRYPLRNLLRQLQSVAGGVKLLLLDTGRVAHDAPRGMVADDFTRRLGEEIAAAGDRRLWVMTSCDATENSHVSRALKRSVFGYFAAAGLAGAGDLDDDEQLDVAELFRYVSVSVGAWVENNTAGSATQTPQLFWGGGDAADAPHAVLVWLAGLREQPQLADHVRSIRAAQQTPSAIGDYQLKSGEQLIAEATRDLIPRSGIGRQVFQAIDQVLPPVPSGGILSAPAVTQEEGEAEKQAEEAEPPELRPLPPDDGLEKGTEQELTPAALLAEAWQWRDVLQRVTAEAARPVDYAPHWWRWLERRLMAHERRLRSGVPGDAADVEQLRQLVRSLRALAADRTDGATPESFAGRVQRFAPRLEVDASRAGSLALAELIANRGGPLLPDDAVDAAEALDALLAREQVSADEFRAWAVALPSRLQRYLELRRAGQLAQLEPFDWTIVRLALVVRRRGERVAAGAVECTPWVRATVDEADRLLHAGERQLLDWPAAGESTEDGDAALALEMLRLADARYRQAEDDLAVLLAARQLTTEALHRAPQYLQWYAIAGDNEPMAPHYEDLRQLIEDAGRVARLLDVADPAGLGELRTLRERLEQRLAALDEPLSDVPVETLILRPHQAGDLWDIELLLSTPLASSSDRIRLIEAAREVDVEVSSRLRLPDAAAADPPRHVLTPTDWRRLYRLAELNRRLASLAHVEGPAKGETPAGSDDSGGDGGQRPADQTLGETLAQLGEAIERRSAERAADQRGERDRAVWSAFDRFGAALGDFYSGLAGQIEGAVSRTGKLADIAQRQDVVRSLRAARWSLFLLDGRDAPRIESRGPARSLEETALYELLLWHRDRFAAAAEDSPPDEAAALRQTAAGYVSSAASVADQPPPTGIVVPPLQVAAPQSLTLTLAPVREMELSVRRYGASDADVRILLEYDPESLTVSTNRQRLVYFRPHGGLEVLPNVDAAALAASDRLAASRLDELAMGLSRPVKQLAELSAKAPTFALRGGEPAVLRLRIEGRRGLDRPTRIIVRAIASDSPAAQSRHDVEVFPALPKAVRLRAEGLPGSYSPSDEGLLLHPYPNQATPYRLGLVNETSRRAEVDVELLSVSRAPPRLLRPMVLSSEERAALFRQLGATTRLARISAQPVAPGGGRTPLILPAGVPGGAPPTESSSIKADGGKSAPSDESGGSAGVGDDAGKSKMEQAGGGTSAMDGAPTGPDDETGAASQAAGAAEAATGGATAGDASDDAAASPRAVLPPEFAPGPIPQLLLGVITNRTSGRTTIEPIRFEPQHPARYVRPRVDYDAEVGRIHITVRPVDPALIPAGGARVAGDVIASLPETAEVLLNGTVKSPNYVTRLHVDAPRGQGREVLLQLHVDGYPRAFSYLVPCDETAVDLPPAADLAQLRITSPAPQTALSAPRETVSVKLEVDLPRGALDAPSNSLVVGIDGDNDRELLGDSPLTLASDRQVSAALAPPTGDGALNVAARVADYELELPAPGLRAGPVNLLARAIVGERVVWSDPVPILLDGAPPRVLSVELDPYGRVVGGHKLEVRVKATDDSLSGIERVEVGYDVERTGRFGVAAPPVVAEFQPDGTWFALPPTGNLPIGKINVLARAIDRVGNVGKFAKAEIEIVTPEQAPPEKPPTQLVMGRVLYGDQPVAGATVTMTDEDGKESPAATTRDDGRFAFDRVPAGKYTVAAKGRAANKDRTAETEVEIKAPPAYVGPVELQIR